MRNYLQLICYCLLLSVAQAQSPIDPYRLYPTSVANAGVKSTDEKAEFVLPTSDGGYLLVGTYFRGGRGLEGRVVKVNQSGQLQWQNVAGSSYDDYLFSAVELNGHYFVVGAEGVSSNNSKSWILKYSTQTGQLVDEFNVNTINGIGDHFLFTVENAGNNRIFIGGAFFDDPAGGSPPEPDTRGFVLTYTEDFIFDGGAGIGTAVHKIERAIDGNYYVFAEGFRPNSNQSCLAEPKPLPGEKANLDDYAPGYYSDILVQKLTPALNPIFSTHIGGNSPDVFVDAVSTPSGGFAVIGKAKCVRGNLTGPGNVCFPTNYFRPYWLYEGSANGSMIQTQCLDSSDPNSFDNDYEPFGLINSCQTSEFIIGYNQGGFAGGALQIWNTKGQLASFFDINIYHTGRDIKRGTNNEIIIGGNSPAVDQHIQFDEDFALFRFSAEGSCQNCPEPELFTDCSEQIDYRYNGSSLSYTFEVANTDDGYSFGKPWRIDGNTVSAGGNSVSYNFSNDGDYQVCYPIETGDEDCYDYCCQTFCIEEQEDCLEGLILDCDLACTCVEAEGLPAPFQCENFESYDQSGLVKQSPYWALWPGTQDDPVVVPGNNGNQLLRVAENSAPANILYLLGDGTGNDLQCGRYRISWRMRISAGANGYYNFQYSREVSGTGRRAFEVFLNNAGGSFVRFDGKNRPFSYPPGVWIDIMHIIDLDQNVMELWIDHQFLVAIPYDEAAQANGFPANLGAINFFSNSQTDFLIDDICVRTTSPDPCPTFFDPVCAKNGIQYSNTCIAANSGLYISEEYGPCSSICDYGGEFIHRSDNFNIQGELNSADLAPELLLQDPGVVDFYGGQVPYPLFADIYVFENESNNEINVSGDVLDDNNVFVFRCVCEGTSCQQEFLGTAETIEGTEQPPGFYYLVIANDETTGGQSYGLNVTPTSDCAITEVLSCGNTYTDNFPTFDDNSFSVSTGDYTTCYVGDRTYEGTDREFRIEITEPSVVDIELTAVGGGAGLFLYSYVCGGNCLDYIETPLSGGQVTLDSVTLAAGNFYLIVDQETPVSSFTISINCVRDEVNYSYGGYFDTPGVDDSECVLSQNSLHTVTLAIPQDRYSPTDIFEFYYGNANGSTASNDSLARYYNGEPLLVFRLPEDESAVPNQCSFESGDLIQAKVKKTNGTNDNIYLLNLSFRQPDGQDATDFNTFTSGGLSYIPTFQQQNTALYLRSTENYLGFPAGSAADPPPPKSFILSASSGLTWTATADASWITTINPATGSAGTSNVVVVVAPNDAPDAVERRATITIETTDPPLRQFVQVRQQAVCLQPNISATASTSRICAGEAVSLRVESGPKSPERYSLVWSTGATDPEIQVIPNSSQTFSVTVTDIDCNLSQTAQVSVQVVAEPQLTVDAPNPQNCSPDLQSYDFTFQTNGNPQPPTVGQLSNLGNGQYRVFGVPADTDLSIVVSNGTCTVSEEIQAPTCVCPAVPAPVSLGDVFICPGDAPQTLAVEVDTDQFAVDWYNANGNLVRTDNTQFLPPAPGDYFAEARDRDATICTSASRTLVRLVERTAITASTDSEIRACVGQTVNLSVAASGGEGTLTYSWSDGLGSGPNAASVSYTPTTAETKVINVTISDTPGQCPVTESISVISVPEPTVSVEAATECSANLQSYRVVIISNAQQTEFAPAGITVQRNGNRHTVSNIPVGQDLLVTGINPNGSESCRTELTVVAPNCACPAVPIPVSLGDVFICPGDAPQTLAVEVDTDQFAVDWYDASGNLVRTDNTQFLPPAPGDYFAEARDHDATVCTSASRTLVRLVERTAITASTDSEIRACVGQTVNLSVAASGGEGTLTYSWSDGLGSGPNAASVSYTPTEAETKVINVTISDTPGQCPVTESISVISVPEPTVSAEAATECSADLQSYRVVIISNAQQTEFAPTGITVQRNGNRHTVSNIPVDQDLLVTGINPNGSESCRTELTVVAPNCACPAVPIPVSLGDVFICPGDAPQTLAVEVDTDQFAVDWYDANGNLVRTDNTQFLPPAPGDYFAEARDRDATVCTSASRTLVRLVERTAITASTDSEIRACVGQTVNLSVAASGGEGTLTYSWSDGLGSGPNAASVSYTPTEAETKVINVTISDTPGQCPVTESISVISVPEPTVSAEAATECSADLQSYRVVIISNAQQTEFAPAGITVQRNGNRHTVSNIPVDQDLLVTGINPNGSESCRTELTVAAPNCACPAVPIPVSLGDVFICPGDAPQTLAVEVDTDQFAVDWYDASGNLVRTDNTQFLPPAPGDYFAEARDRDATVCTSASRTLVRLVERTAITASTDNEIRACVGQTVNLSVAASGGEGTLTYSWSDGLGSGPNAASVSYTPTEAETKVINVTISDTPGQCPVTESISVISVPEPTLSRESVAECSADNQSYRVVIISDAQQTEFAPTGVAVERSGNRYTVSDIPVDQDLLVTGINPNGSESCRAELTVDRPTNCNCGSMDTPAAEMETGNFTICADQEIPEFKANDPGDEYTIDWHDNPGASGDPLLSGSLNFRPTEGGTYYAVVRHLGSACVSATPTPAQLTVHPIPVADAGADLALCANSVHQLDAAAGSSGAGTLSYTWTPAEVLEGANTATPTIKAQSSTSLLLEVKDGNGCIQTDELQVEVVPRPVGSITVEQTISCFGAADGRLAASITGGTGPYDVKWSNNRTQPVIANLPMGNYAFVVTDDNSCKDTAFVSLTQPDSLEVSGVELMPIRVNGNVVETAGQIAPILQGGVPPYTFQWLTEDEIRVGTDSVLSTEIDAVYILEITDDNGCTMRDTFQLDIVNPVDYLHLEQSIRVFPNPTSSWLNIDFDLAEPTEIQIDLLDALGRRVITTPPQPFQRQQLSLDLSKLSAGHYWLKFQFQEGYFLRGIIRN